MRMKTKTYSCMRIFVGCLAILAAVIYLFPVWWAILSAFKSEGTVVTLPPLIFFKPTVKTFYAILFEKDFLHALSNSAIICGISIIIALVLGTLAGYGLARFRIPGKENIAFWILSTKMLPPVATIIPFFIIFRNLGLIDTYRGLIILYILIALPLVVWITRSFFERIPVSLEEAAMVDGCSRLTAIFRITLPLSVPGIAVSAFFSFVFTWNELLYALILTTERAKTVAVACNGLIEMRRLLWNEVGVAATLMIIPIIIFAIIFRKYMVSGLTLGAVRE
jgi:multiple sugar transport system permease protein